MKPFNDVHTLLTNARTCPRAKWNFSGTSKQFWPDALDATDERVRLTPGRGWMAYRLNRHHPIGPFRRIDEIGWRKSIYTK